MLARVEERRSNAVGTVPWAIPCEAIDPATFEPAADGHGRAVVLQTRDAHRDAAVLALVERLERVVVVEYGWPGPWPVDAPRICAHGASLPARAAVAELLRASGWVP